MVLKTRGIIPEVFNLKCVLLFRSAGLSPAPLQTAREYRFSSWRDAERPALPVFRELGGSSFAAAPFSLYEGMKIRFTTSVCVIHTVQHYYPVEDTAEGSLCGPKPVKTGRSGRSASVFFPPCLNQLGIAWERICSRYEQN